MGLVTPTEVADHVEPHRGDMVKFWNRAMWQGACRWHHDVIKQKLEAMHAKGEVVVADLWLDSQVAVRLTLAELPVDVGVGGGQKFTDPSQGPAL
ncbi:UNVERIFIED_ORG: capsule polysaccharide modification protein KpsS [Bradyrhizobium japonicum]